MIDFEFTIPSFLAYTSNLHYFYKYDIGSIPQGFFFIFLFFGGDGA
jgi:hypothetical protein